MLDDAGRRNQHLSREEVVAGAQAAGAEDVPFRSGRPVESQADEQDGKMTAARLHQSQTGSAGSPVTMPDVKLFRTTFY